MSTLALWMLHGTLRDVDHLNAEALVLVDRINRLNSAMTEIQVHLYELQSGRERHLDTLIDDVEAAEGLITSIGSHYLVHGPDTKDHYLDLQTRFPRFRDSVSSLATVQDIRLTAEHNLEAMRLAVGIRESVRHIGAQAKRHAREEQSELGASFRRIVLGTAIGYALVINVSIIILLRAASLIIRPVDKLVETSRQLTHKHSGNRAEGRQNDEFLELAEAYDLLAEQVRKAEQQRMETLTHVAVTLNHELNNALATIEMQLRILGRNAKSDQRLESSLRNIRESMNRMSHTVESLKRIKQIVLTEYSSGIQMLDLKRSTQENLAMEPDHLPSTTRDS